MTNGSFSYDLFFLKTDTSKKQVKYSEDGKQFDRLESIDEGDYIVVKNLDHFTIFVMVDPDPVNEDCSNTVLIGDKCFNTIQAAVDAASPSAVISIKNGTYLENIILDKFGISLVGESKNGVIIKNPVVGSDSIGITVQANGISIKNLTIREFADGVSLSDVDGFILDGNLISDNSYSIPSGIHILDSKNVDIKNNEFNNNSVAVDLSETTPGTVLNVTLTNNTFSGNSTNLVNNIQSDISEAANNNWGSSDIDVIESSIVHGCSANKYLHGACNGEDLSSEFGSVKYANINIPSFTVPVCDSLTNQSAIAPAWSNVAGANVSYVVERTSPTGEIVLDSSTYNMNLDGIWKWRIKATAGSQDSGYSDYCKITYDGTVPTNPGTPGTLSPTRALVQGWSWEESTDVLSGLKDYSWSVTGGSVGTTTNSFLTTFLTQGTWNLNVIANDKAGNKSSTSSGTLIVDRSSPNISANSDLVLSVVDIGDAGIYISKYNWDSNASASIGTSFINGQTINIPSEGEHTLYLYAEDNAGNSNTWSGLYKLDTTDTTKPVSSVTSPAYDNSGTIPLNFTSTDDSSGVAKIELWYRFNGGNWINYGTASSFDPNNIDGTYEFYSIATDVSGNVETAPLVADSNTIFDHTNPTVSANNATNVWYTTNPNIVLSVSDSVAKYHWDTAASAIVGTDFINGQTINIPSEGEHVLYLYAEDKAGNFSTWSGLYKLDTVKPTGVWLLPTSGSTISGTVNLSIDTNDTVVYKYAPDGSAIFTTITGTSWDTTSLALGKYMLRATITDIAGNSTDVDENIYVAAVITNFTHHTIATDKIQVDWITDRPTNGYVVYDKYSHLLISEYPFKTGTNYGTSHSVVISGLSSGTYYHYRAVSGDTAVVVSKEESDRTFSEAGLPSPSNSSFVSTTFSTPTPTPVPTLIPIVEREQVAGVETTPTPTPTIERVLSTQDSAQPNYIFFAVLFSVLSFVFIIFIIKMHV